MPVLVEEMGQLFRLLKQKGVTLLLVEQNVEWALNLADRAVIIDQGEVVHRSSAADTTTVRDPRAVPGGKANEANLATFVPSGVFLRHRRRLLSGHFS